MVKNKKDVYQVKTYYKGRGWVDKFDTKEKANEYARVVRKDIKSTVTIEKRLAKKFPRGVIKVSKYSVKVVRGKK